MLRKVAVALVAASPHAHPHTPSSSPSAQALRRISDMRPDRLGRKEEPKRDFFTGQPVGKERDDLALARRQDGGRQLAVQLLEAAIDKELAAANRSHRLKQYCQRAGLGRDSVRSGRHGSCQQPGVALVAVDEYA